MAVRAEDRAEAAKLVPADDEFLHVGALVRLFTATATAAHIGRPARHAFFQSPEPKSLQPKSLPESLEQSLKSLTD